jgi:hypothetical protein
MFLIQHWNKINEFIIRHSWINSASTVLMTVFGYFLGRDVQHLIPEHPHLFILLNEYIIPISPWILIFSFIFFIYSSYIEYRNKPRINIILKELEETKNANIIISERIRDLFDGYLYNLASKLGFGAKGQNSERITLFIHDNNKNLIPFSRYSANPKYRNIKRISSPDNEGCIAKAWENGWHFDANFPCPEVNKKEYSEYSYNKYLIPKNVCKQLSMPSRLFASLRIEYQGTPLAVVVLETESPDRYKEAFIKEILNKQNDYLSQTIKKLYEYIPRPSISSSRGL